MESENPRSPYDNPLCKILLHDKMLRRLEGSFKEKFRKYPSINNLDNGSFLRYSNLTNESEWIVTEKIHGANFAFYIDFEKNIKVASRNRIILDGEYFYNSKMLINKFSESLISLFDLINFEFQSIEYIVIYGEIYGGYYPNVPKLKSVKGPIQQNVWYSPDYEFMAFDFAFKLKENLENFNFNLDDLTAFKQKQKENDNLIFLPFLKAKDLANKVNLPFIDYLFIGSLKNAIEASMSSFENQTYLPKFHKQKIIPDNIREGNIIRPNNDCKSPTGERIIIKHKNKRFSEVKNPKFSVITLDDSDSDINLTNIKEFILNCITIERINNAKSHGEFSLVAIKKEVKADLIKEILENYPIVKQNKNLIRKLVPFIENELSNFLKENNLNEIGANFT